MHPWHRQLGQALIRRTPQVLVFIGRQVTAQRYKSSLPPFAGIRFTTILQTGTAIQQDQADKPGAQPASVKQ